MDYEKLRRIKFKAYQRLCVLRTRASDDERDLDDGGQVKPRYRSVARAAARWKRLNDIYTGFLRQRGKLGAV